MLTKRNGRKTSIGAALLGAALTLIPAAVAVADEKAAPAPAERPTIELAILLDTSGSMDGLIDQARARLWSIVNDMARTSKGGSATDLRVALFEYGNDGVPAEQGHIRLIVPLTDDLDEISKQLFALTTNGGSEHCGQAIETAINALEWKPGDHYRSIFIAGNEEFTQGPTDYVEACRAAIGKGIMVNTIHCGAPNDGLEGKWTHAASLADGQALNIDQNVEAAAIQTPYDEKLAELGQKINKTYLAFGRKGAEKKDRQSAQDELAREAPAGSMAERSVAKAGRHYRNSDWDLVDALEDGELDADKLGKLKEEELPEEMRGLSGAERKAYVDAKKAERASIQKEIAELDTKRREFISAEQAKRAGEGQETFGSAVKAILRKQLEKKGFELKD